MNTALVVLIALFLIFEYQHQRDERLREKRIAMEEEAKTLLPAVRQLWRFGPTHVQYFVDSVCGRMQEQQSPLHHIAVLSHGVTIQATAHHRASPEMLRAMQRASKSPDRRARFGDAELVVGKSEHGDVAVFVSEGLANLERSLRAEMIRHLAGVIILALALGAIINVVLLRIVTRPLNRLVRAVRKIGGGDLSVQVGRFGSHELDYLAAEIGAMESSLAAADRNRVVQMAKAREIQENLLPDERQIPGLSVARLFQPADEVGGDFYDILRLNGWETLFCLADVTGHGVPAAMSAAMLKSLMANAVERFHDPDEIMEWVNRRFTQITLYGDFATVFLVHLDPETMRLRYASAGHEVAWLLDANGNVRELRSTGMVLGLREDTSWDMESLSISPGDRLLMVTDGVTETQSGNGDAQFGRDRLARLFQEIRSAGLDRVVERIDHELAAFRCDMPPHDDITVVVVEVEQTAGG